MWTFGKVNGHLAEIFFDKEKGKPAIVGFCYVKASAYKTAKEKKYIKEDTKKHRLSYRNKKFRDLISGKELPSATKFFREIEDAKKGKSYTIDELTKKFRKE